MKAVILKVVLSVIVLGSSFSFANWGGAYQYMKGESSPLPISQALYLKEDGTVCVADFEGQSEDLLAQLKSHISVTKCSEEDAKQIATTYNRYFYNNNNSFKATKVTLPAIAGAVGASALMGCFLGWFGADVTLDLRELKRKNSKEVEDTSNLYPEDSVLFGVMFGALTVPWGVAMLEETASISLMTGSMATIIGAGAASALICGKTTYELADPSGLVPAPDGEPQDQDTM